MQLERTDLHAAIQLRYPDNLTGDITPQLLRDGLDKLVDSLFVIATDTGAVPNVPEYKAGTTYVKGFTVRWTLATREAFYAAQSAGRLPAPIGPGDPNWKEVAPPVTATALWQSITLTQAQNMDGAGLIDAGRLYRIDCGLSSTGRPQLVYLMGLDQYFDTTRGVLESGGRRTAIEKIDLGAGTWTVSGSVVATDPSLSFAYAALTLAATTTWDVATMRHAAAYLNLQADTKLALVNGADGFVGTILVHNTMLSALKCELPAGCFGPKNYAPALAPDERRLLTATYAAGTWYFNSAIYYPQ